jgi:hypothetical protein
MVFGIWRASKDSVK